MEAVQNPALAEFFEQCFSASTSLIGFSRRKRLPALSPYQPQKQQSLWLHSPERQYLSRTFYQGNKLLKNITLSCDCQFERFGWEALTLKSMEPRTYGNYVKIQFFLSNKSTHATISFLMRASHFRTELLSCKTFLKQKLKKRIVKSKGWPQSSLNCDPLYHHFYIKVKAQMYHSCRCKPFINKNKMAPQKTLFRRTVTYAAKIDLRSFQS